MKLQHAAAHDIELPTLYRLLQLRSQVFVVEQRSPYLDLDGNDLSAETTHIWATESDGGSELLGYVRVLTGSAGGADGAVGAVGAVVGRVCVAPAARGRGLGATLMTAAHEVVGDMSEVVLHAQTHLEAWYGRFGYVRSGPDFDDAGVPHVPMVRPAPGKSDGPAR